LISFYLAPWAEEQSYRIQDIEKSSTELGGIIPGRFTETTSSEGVIYVSEVSQDRATMKDVFIQTERDGQQVILSSKSAHQLIDQKTGDRYIVLVDGYRYEGVPGKPDFKIIKYQQHAMRIEEQQIVQSYRKHRARPTVSLIGSDDSRDIAELQWRISMPLSVMLLAIMAVPLSRTTPRQGRYAKLFVAVMIYVIYNNLLGIANSWVEDGKIDAAIGMWWVHLALLFGVWLLLVFQYGFVWVLRAMVGRTVTP
jgi:lipopolysaccharide export system permease protein